MKYLISGSTDNCVRIWNIENKECVEIVDIKTDWVGVIIPTLNDRYFIIACDDSIIRIYDYSEKKIIFILNDH